jgi:hypothetical protein
MQISPSETILPESLILPPTVRVSTGVILFPIPTLKFASSITSAGLGEDLPIPKLIDVGPSIVAKLPSFVVTERLVGPLVAIFCIFAGNKNITVPAGILVGEFTLYVSVGVGPPLPDTDDVPSPIPVAVAITPEDITVPAGNTISIEAIVPVVAVVNLTAYCVALPGKLEAGCAAPLASGAAKASEINTNPAPTAIIDTDKIIIVVWLNFNNYLSN